MTSSCRFPSLSAVMKASLPTCVISDTSADGYARVSNLKCSGKVIGETLLEPSS